MKKPSAVITLMLCLLLVTSAVSVIGPAPINVIILTANPETKTTAEMPDAVGGVIGIPNTDEREALVACPIQRGTAIGVSSENRVTGLYGWKRWREHPAFIGIA